MEEQTRLSSTLRLQTQSESDEDIIEGFQFQLDDLAKSALSSEQIHLLLCREGPDNTLTIRINGMPVVGKRLADEACPHKNVVERVSRVIPAGNDEVRVKTEGGEATGEIDEPAGNHMSLIIREASLIDDAVNLPETSKSYQGASNLLKRPRQGSNDSVGKVEHPSTPLPSAAKRQKRMSELSSVELELQRKLLVEFEQRLNTLERRMSTVNGQAPQSLLVNHAIPRVGHSTYSEYVKATNFGEPLA